MSQLSLPPIVQKLKLDAEGYLSNIRAAADAAMYFGNKAGENKSRLDLISDALKGAGTAAAEYASGLNKITPQQVTQFNQMSKAIDAMRTAMDGLANVKLPAIRASGQQGNILDVLGEMQSKGIRGATDQLNREASNLERTLDRLSRLGARFKGFNTLLPEGTVTPRPPRGRQENADLAAALMGLPKGSPASRMLASMAAGVGLAPLGGIGPITSGKLGIPYNTLSSGFVGPISPFHAGGGPFVGPPRSWQYWRSFPGFVGPEYPFKRGQQPFVGPERSEQYNAMFRPSGFMGPEYPFKTGTQPIQGPFRGAGPHPSLGAGFATPGALPGGMSFLGSGAAVIGGTLAGVAAGAYLVKKAFDAVIDSASRLGSLALQGVQSLAHGLEFLAQKGMEVERLETTFGVLLKSVQAGKEEFKALQGISIVTPYSVESLSDASQILLGMGVDAKNLNGLLLQMGDIAAGDTGRLRRLAVVFGEVAAEGKLTGWRIRQLASLGVGIADMAKTMGVPTEVFRALTSANLVPSDILTKTLESLTSEGGRFFKMNESQLEKAYGQWHRFENVVDVTLSNIGKKFLEGAGIDEGLARMSNLINDMMPTLERLGAYVGKAFYAITSQFANLKYAIASSIGGKGAGDTFLDMLPSPEQLGQWTKKGIEFFVELGRVIAHFASTFLHAVEAIAEGLVKIGNLPESLAAKFPLLAAGVAVPLKMMELGVKGYTSPGGAALGQLASGDLSRKTAINKWFDELRASFSSAPAQSMNSYRGSASKHGYTVSNPFKLSTPAQAILEEIYVEQGGGKMKGAGTGSSALKEFSRAMESISEIETKGRWANVINQVGTVGAGFAVAGLAAYGGAVNNSPMAYFTERNVRAGQGFMGLLPEKTQFPQDILDEKKYEHFLALRQKVGGNISDSLTPAALYGSIEAVDTINKTNVDNRSVLDEMLSVAQAALDADNQRAELIRQVVAAIKELPPEAAKYFGAGGI